MLRQRRVVKLIMFVLAFLISLIGINGWGWALGNHAAKVWLDKAELETQQITHTSLNWMSLFHSQLRGVAALFYGSQFITEDEFFKGVELMEEIENESVIPLTSVAYVSVMNSNSPDMESKVRYSTDVHGVLAKKGDLRAQPAIASVVRQALASPSQVILSPMFIDDYGKLFIAFAFSAANDNQPGVVLSLVNLSDFFADLSVLHVSNGLRLRMVERLPVGEGGREMLVEHLMVGSPDADDIVETFYYQTRSGNARWDFYWDVEANYQGGSNRVLGWVVHIGGTALVLALFSIIGALARQNILVINQVKIRTHELAEASGALEKSNEELRELANRDSLTNAYNRRYFMAQAESACARSKRYRLPLTLLMLDVDYFKQVNDRCGHGVGDAVLLDIVNVCNRELREVDSFGRIGGEEFAILLPETSLEAAYAVAERLRHKVSELSFNDNGELISVTVSMGVSHFYTDGEDALNRLLKRADEALYAAKEGGRNRVVVYGEDNSPLT